MKFRIVGTFLLAMSSSSFGASVSTTTTITGIYTYGVDTGFSQNLISVTVANPLIGCKGGFWVHPTDNLDNKAIASFLLSAFHSSSRVYFAAYNNQLWGGNYCKIHSIGLVK